MVRFLLRFAIKVAINAGALAASSRLIQGFEITGRSFPLLGGLNIPPVTQSLVIGGLVLALLNIFLRPVLKFVSFPIIIITFGLFSIVINFIILYLADVLLAELTIQGVRAFLFGSFLIGIVNAII